MVEVTIRTDFKKDKEEHRMEPCDLAFLACVSSSNHGEKYHSNGAIVGGEGLDMCITASILAETAVHALISLAEDSRRRQTHILLAYCKAFVDHAADKAGTEVMNDVMKLIMDEE